MRIPRPSFLGSRASPEAPTPERGRSPAGPAPAALAARNQASPDGKSAASPRPRQSLPGAQPPQAREAKPSAPTQRSRTPGISMVDDPRASRQSSVKVIQALQSGDAAASHQALGQHLQKFGLPEAFDGSGYHGEEKAILKAVAEHGDAGHLDQLLAKGRLDPDLRKSDFLARMVAHNSDVTRPVMLERMLGQDVVRSDRRGLAGPLWQAARRGLTEETNLLLKVDANRRKDAMNAAFNAGHTQLGLSIDQHIRDNPRENRVRKLLGGLGDKLKLR